jgi:hypothetical protein
VSRKLGVFLVSIIGECSIVGSCFRTRNAKTVAGVTETVRKLSGSVASLKREGSDPKGTGPLFFKMHRR